MPCLQSTWLPILHPDCTPQSEYSVCVSAAQASSPSTARMSSRHRLLAAHIAYASSPSTERMDANMASTFVPPISVSMGKDPSTLT